MSDERAVAATSREVVVFGETIVDCIEGRQILGGAPCNVARHLAGLGCVPRFISRVGADALGDLAARELVGFGLDPRGLQRDPQLPTAVAQVLLGPQGPRFEIPPVAAFDFIDADAASRVLDEVRTQEPLLYFGTLAQRGAASRQALRVLRGASGVQGCADLNLRAEVVDAGALADLLHGSVDLKLSQEELETVLRLLGLDAAGMPEAQIGEALARGLGLERLQRLHLTRGAQGSLCLQRGGRPALSVRPRQGVPVVDTVGAGDAYCAVILLGLARAWPLQQTMQRASDFAAAICGVPGAVPAGLDFYADWRRAFDGEMERGVRT